MSQRPRVFLDTSVIKHSIRSRGVLKPRSQQPRWVGQVVYDLVDEDPTSRVHDEPLRTEIDLLSRVAELARRGEIELLSHVESQLEFWGILLVPGGGISELLVAGITHVEGPIKYSRIIAAPFLGEPARTLQIRFLRSLQHQRYLDLQRACGAHQGDHVNEKQLLDAFHIWCAEEAGATHFLTTDFKLLRAMRSHKTYPPQVRVVVPSELLNEISEEPRRLEGSGAS